MRRIRKEHQRGKHLHSDSCIVCSLTAEKHMKPVQRKLRTDFNRASAQQQFNVRCLRIQMLPYVSAQCIIGIRQKPFGIYERDGNKLRNGLFAQLIMHKYGKRRCKSVVSAVFFHRQISFSGNGALPGAQRILIEKSAVLPVFPHYGIEGHMAVVLKHCSFYRRDGRCAIPHFYASAVNRAFEQFLHIDRVIASVFQKPWLCKVLMIDIAAHNIKVSILGMMQVIQGS